MWKTLVFYILLTMVDGESSPFGAPAEPTNESAAEILEREISPEEVAFLIRSAEQKVYSIDDLYDNSQLSQQILLDVLISTDEKTSVDKLAQTDIKNVDHITDAVGDMKPQYKYPKEVLEAEKIRLIKRSVITQNLLSFCLDDENRAQVKLELMRLVESDDDRKEGGKTNKYHLKPKTLETLELINSQAYTDTSEKARRLRLLAWREHLVTRANQPKSNGDPGSLDKADTG